MDRGETVIIIIYLHIVMQINRPGVLYARPLFVLVSSKNYCDILELKYTKTVRIHADEHDWQVTQKYNNIVEQQISTNVP